MCDNKVVMQRGQSPTAFRLVNIFCKGMRKLADNAYQNSSGNGKKGLANGWKVAIIAILGALMLSPLDVIPDGFPVVGFADDIAYLIGIITTVANMINGRKATSVDEDAPYTPPMYNDVDNNSK